MIVDQHIGRRLRERRIEQGLSPEELGRLLGASRDDIERMEAGERRIAASQLYLLSQILDIEVATLFEGFGQDGARQSTLKLSHPAEALRLMRAFHAISGREDRRRVIDLAESLSS